MTGHPRTMRSRHTAQSAAFARRSAVLAGLLVTACGSPAPLTTAVQIPAAPRRPDGVLVEPPLALPPATDRAPARGVVALREPLADEAIGEVVREYVRAWVTESRAALDQLLTQDCVSLDPQRQPRAAILESFKMRMNSLDYKKLAGTDVARLDAIERYGYAELGSPGVSRAPPRPPEMRAGDVLARVPIATPRVGAEQLFPEVLVLLLRREEGKYRIAGIGEENGR